MGLIVTEIYDALIEAGAGEEKARAAAAAIPFAEHLATREDLGDIRTGLKGDIAELRTELKGDIAELRTELKGEIAELRTELKGDIAELRTEFKGDIAELRTEFKGDIARLDKRIAVLNLGVFSFGPAILALLVKLAFFP